MTSEKWKYPSHALRLQVMMDVYRRGRTFGILENKLLSNTLLGALQIPAMRVLYGAFAHAPMGKWPKYSREALAAALRRHKLGAERGFVLKPASDGTSAGVLFMTPDKWRSGNWTESRVLKHADSFLYKERVSLPRPPTPVCFKKEDGLTPACPPPFVTSQSSHLAPPPHSRRGVSTTSSEASSFRRSTRMMRRRRSSGRTGWQR